MPWTGPGAGTRIPIADRHQARSRPVLTDTAWRSRERHQPKTLRLVEVFLDHKLHPMAAARPQNGQSHCAFRELVAKAGLCNTQRRTSTRATLRWHRLAVARAMCAISGGAAILRLHTQDADGAGNTPAKLLCYVAILPWVKSAALGQSSVGASGPANLRRPTNPSNPFGDCQRQA